MGAALRSLATVTRSIVTLAALTGTLTAAGCAHVPTADELNRSTAETNLAGSLHEEGDIPAAIAHLRRAIELNPDNVEAHVLLGYIQMERGEFDAACGNLEHAVSALVAQERLGAQLAETRNMLGACLIRVGRNDDAVRELELSAHDELNTTPYLAYGNLGLAYMAAGRLEDAQEALVEAVRRQPSFCVGFYRLGQVLFQREQYDHAEEALSSALTARDECGEHPGLQGAWRLRGEARARLGLGSEAAADFERCLELAPGTADGRRCQSLLEDVE